MGWTSDTGDGHVVVGARLFTGACDRIVVWSRKANDILSLTPILNMTDAAMERGVSGANLRRDFAYCSRVPVAMSVDAVLIQRLPRSDAKILCPFFNAPGVLILAFVLRRSRHKTPSAPRGRQGWHFTRGPEGGLPPHEHVPPAGSGFRDGFCPTVA